jgi:hypothetical protein
MWYIVLLLHEKWVSTGEYLKGTNPIWDNCYYEVESSVYMAVKAVVWSPFEVPPTIIANIEFQTPEGLNLNAKWHWVDCCEQTRSCWSINSSILYVIRKFESNYLASKLICKEKIREGNLSKKTQQFQSSIYWLLPCLSWRDLTSITLYRGAQTQCTTHWMRKSRVERYIMLKGHNIIPSTTCKCDNNEDHKASYHGVNDFCLNSYND